MAEPPTLNQDTSVKKRAIRRLVIAVILIGAAIIGLTLVDRLTVVERPKPRPVPSIAVAPPLPPPAESTTPPESPPAGAATPDSPPPPEVSRVPDAHLEGKPPAAPPASSPGEPSPAAPAVGATAPKGAREAQGPSAAPGTAPRSPVTGPSAQSATGPAAPAQGVTGASKPPSAPGIPQTGASSAGPSATRQAPAAGSNGPMLKLEEAPVAADKGYTVQMGVFNTYANADALLARLKERGVPAYAETRVLVGPFRSRQEARQAAQTLKDMGAGPILSPTAR